MRPQRCFALPAGVLCLLLVPLSAAYAQEKAPDQGQQADKAQDWEDKVVSFVEVQNAVRESKTSITNLSGINRGTKVTRDRINRVYHLLMDTGRFNDVQILPPVPDPNNAGQFILRIRVEEYLIIESVEFKGLVAIPLNQVRPNLRLNAGDPYNPYFLMLDRNYIREQYLSKGYHFSSVEDSTRPGTAGGLILTWTIMEGPMVSVDRILFTGNQSVDESELRRFMITKENGRLWFIPTGKEPFVERNVVEDIKRIKLYYQLEGWLDIGFGENVFIEDLLFSEDKTSVTIQIHVEEGKRYKIRSVRFQFDPSVQTPQFSPEEMRLWLLTKPDEPYTENNAGRDAAKIREKYGERAYILAEVAPTTIIDRTRPELDLVYAIKENQKIYVGKIQFEGNVKTREDVLRRELTRTGFVPADEYNKRSLDRGLRRIQDRGWVEMPAGLQVRTQDTDDPQTRDVVIDIKEGQTGSIRFAAGYSSSFGILGILEFQQRNFDLGDVPSSFEDMIGGTGFAGGGQFLRIRLAPAARRQSYSIDFKEPYVFGYDFGLGVRAYALNTLRESYNDRRLGGSISVDKRFEPMALQLTFDAYRVNIDSVSDGAPLAVQQIEGVNRVVSLTPAIIYDTRDSIIFPTEGLRATVSYQYAGQVLPGDFNFNKFSSELEGHVTVLETEGHLKHVISMATTFGWVHGARHAFEVPIIERFYAGGRDGPRGFQFRGVGPHDQGDPIGGEAFALGTVEYSYPLFVEFLRGAFFYDVGNLTPRIDDLAHVKWRNTVGFGIRFIIPQLGNIPVKLDFGFPLSKRDEDERQTVTFDIGALF
jgi:outer membrane protein insertion porin family